MDDREAILARRRRLVALALAGGAVASTASCSVCLTPMDAGQPDAPEIRDTPDDSGTAPDAEGPDAGPGDGDGG